MPTTTMVTSDRSDVVPTLAHASTAKKLATFRGTARKKEGTEATAHVDREPATIAKRKVTSPETAQKSAKNAEVVVATKIETNQATAITGAVGETLTDEASPTEGTVETGAEIEETSEVRDGL